MFGELELKRNFDFALPDIRRSQEVWLGACAKSVRIGSMRVSRQH